MNAYLLHLEAQILTAFFKKTFRENKIIFPQLDIIATGNKLHQKEESTLKIKHKNTKVQTEKCQTSVKN